jgi:hypothetical protein
LQIVLANPLEDSALIGAAYLALDDLFSPANVEKLIGRFAVQRHARVKNRA